MKANWAPVSSARLLAPKLAASILALGMTGLAGCTDRVIPEATSTASTPRPSSTPRPAQAPPPTASQTWADMPATPGDWRWSNEGGRSVARFAGGQLVLRCDPAARTVSIERAAGSAPAAALTIRTQTQARALSATAASGAIVATVPARDPLLDAMAFSKGRFAVESAGQPTLYVPSWTEVSRVVEDCR